MPGPRDPKPEDLRMPGVQESLRRIKEQNAAALADILKGSGGGEGSLASTPTETEKQPDSNPREESPGRHPDKVYSPDEPRQSTVDASSELPTTTSQSSWKWGYWVLLGLGCVGGILVVGFWLSQKLHDFDTRIRVVETALSNPTNLVAATDFNSIKRLVDGISTNAIARDVEIRVLSTNLLSLAKRLDEGKKARGPNSLEVSRLAKLEVAVSNILEALESNGLLKRDQ